MAREGRRLSLEEEHVEGASALGGACETADTESSTLFSFRFFYKRQLSTLNIVFVYSLFKTKKKGKDLACV